MKELSKVKISQEYEYKTQIRRKGTFHLNGFFKITSTYS